jgi:hypothetical protein
VRHCSVRLKSHHPMLSRVLRRSRCLSLRDLMAGSQPLERERVIKHHYVEQLLDCIPGDGKPRLATAHANTVTKKTTTTKGKAHVP